MNYLILITVVASLIIILKCTMVILKASKRVNLLYDYFIIKGEVSTEELTKMLKSISDRPDPNDGSGCPKEEELTNEN